MKQPQQPKHESERVFLDMLFEAGVQPNWTWDDTMRAVINHPNYRILATAKERKDAFSRYADYKKGKDKVRPKWPHQFYFFTTGSHSFM